jgi:uncharacterized protein
MATEDIVQVEVVYARIEEQVIVALDVPRGATVRDAILMSGLTRRFPELGATQGRVGIYGKSVLMDQELRAGDRVEIYRPLVADPKQARRRRAAGKTR